MNDDITKNKNLFSGVMLILLSWVTTGYCFSQGTEIDIAGKRPAYLEWSIGPSQNSYSVNVSPDVASPVTKNDVTLFTGLEAGYLFTNHFGVSVGLGLSSITNRLSVSSFSDQFDTRDSEMESYERRITGKDIIEKQEISFLNIPFQLNLLGSLSRSAGFYIQSGVSISLPVKKSYNSTGTFTYTGYYPGYNVLIEDVIYEGFRSDVKNDVNGTLQLKKINPQFTASAGLQFFLQGRLQFSIGINYIKLIANPSDYDSNNTFHLSDNPGQMHSLMEGADDVTTGSVGLKIGFRFYLM